VELKNQAVSSLMSEMILAASTTLRQCKVWHLIGGNPAEEQRVPRGGLKRTTLRTLSQSSPVWRQFAFGSARPGRAELRRVDGKPALYIMHRLPLTDAVKMALLP